MLYEVITHANMATFEGLRVARREGHRPGGRGPRGGGGRDRDGGGKKDGGGEAHVPDFLKD